MPTYNFLDTTTEQEFTSFMSISEREEYLVTNPHIKPCVSSPAIVSGVGANGPKTDDGFKSLLKKIATDHPRNTIRY